MIGKIILVPAPAQMLRGWEGRFIFRKVGAMVGFYKIKKIIVTRVFLHPYKLTNVSDENCYKADMHDGSFYMPVVFLPQAAEEENRFQELSYECWSKSKYHITKYRATSYRTQNYQTHYVHVKIKNSIVRIGARSPFQQFNRSWPKIELDLGW